jgi:DNA helicase II / ATP-dependent DNA helicase PcrA
MAYANLPFEVPGVTSAAPPPADAAAEQDPRPEPQLLRAWPTTSPEPSGRDVRPQIPDVDDASRSAALLAGLLSEQRRAVRHQTGPLLVSAGPGTGKTLTLATRIAYLVQEQLARPHELVAVTFTTSAVEEMRLRLIDLMGIAGAASINVCTIHKLCGRVVRAHAAAFGRNEHYLICDRPTSDRIVRAILAERTSPVLRAELGAHDPPAADEVCEQIGQAKNRLWSIEDYLENSPYADRTLVAAVWRELEVRLELANAFDFEDLLVCAVSLLREDPRLRAHYRERYRWMLIDEFQDVNVAQMELVRQLMAPDGNLTAVGDEDQCLYAFRFAEPGNMLDFAVDFPRAVKLALSVNHRSRPQILAAAQRVIEHNENRSPKSLLPRRAPGGFLGVRNYSTDEHESTDLASLILTELEVGRDPHEILVLCSRRRPLQQLQQRLERRGIKVRLLGGLSLWERSEVRDAIAHLQLLANPFDVDAFRRVVNAPSDRKPFQQGAVNLPSRRRGDGADSVVRFADESCPDLIAASLRADEIGSLSDDVLGPLRELAAALDRIRDRAWRQRGEAGSLTALVQCVLQIPSGPTETYTLLRDHARQHTVREDANRILEDLRSLTRACRTYEESTQETPPTLAGFVDSLDTSGPEVDAEQDDRVTLATVHTAKGSEAESVIVIGLEDNLLPDWRADREQSDLEGQRNVFYTAATRAKDNLLFTHVATRDGNSTDGPSRFLLEAGLA